MAIRLGGGLLAVAGALVVVAVLVRGGAGSSDIDVEGAVASVSPSTIPVTTPPTGAPTTSAEPTSTTATTLALSPLASELPARTPAQPTTNSFVAPTAITIDGLRLWAPIRGIGVEPDGQLEIPDETEVGWYRLGAAPGQAGATVLAAHVSWNDTIGPFFRLGELQPGARVQLDLADGSRRGYEVVERAQYPKLELPVDRIWTRGGDESLVMITCGGEFNRSIRRYRDNIVVYAVPVANEPGPA